MASKIELDCICGAKLHVPDDPAAGGTSLRCGACGAEILFEVEEETGFCEGDPFPGDAPGGFALPDTRCAPPFRDPALQCPSCGGQAQVVYRGPRGRDRVLACPYCRSEVDLPEARGVTRERVTERPNEKIVERVTQWEGTQPELDERFDGPRPEVRNQTRVHEYSSVVTKDLGGGDAEARDRPIPAETLAKIRKHFKRKA